MFGNPNERVFIYVLLLSMIASGAMNTIGTRSFIGIQ